MEKIKYLLKRIANMNFGAMFEKINVVHKKTGKNRLFIFFDVVYCGLKYQAGYVDYELFEMYNLNKEQRKTILTRGINNSYIKKFNDPSYRYILQRKDETNKLFQEFLNRDWLDFNNCTKKEFDSFVSKHNEIMVKPINGTCGKGIEKIKVKDFSKKELYDYLKEKKEIILEEVIKQHPDMNKLYPGSINTCRIVSILKDNKVNIVVAYLRVGNGAYVDNFNSGGMVVPINVETGRIEYPALDKNHNLYEKHPQTGTSFIGFKIPMWEEAMELVKKAGPKIPQVRFAGWDVCISEKGPILVETNDFPGHDIYQLPPHRTNGIGVLPHFEKAIYGDNNQKKKR